MPFLGIDLGTSGLRLLLVDDGGTPIGSSERHYPVSNPKPGWSEQDPKDWITALEEAVSELRQKHPEFAAVQGIGVSGHMHGATLLDGSGNVLRPCILWNDTRAHVEAARMDREAQFRAVSGNIVFPGFTAPKLEWVRANEPEIHSKISKVLLPAAFMNHYLTGEFVADMSDSAGTSWLDVGKREWSRQLLDASNMRREQMPDLVEGSQVAGQLRSRLLSEWGLDGPVAVAGGAGDNAAAACGIGALTEGQGFISLGTSGVLLTARDGYHPDPGSALHTFCHAVPDRWYQMGVMLAATDCLNWLSRITGVAPADLTAPLEGALRPPSKTRFLPYLSGERTPHNDADIRGSFTGLETITSRDDLTRAVLEGVAFGLRDSFEALKATSVVMNQLMIIGGGSNSRYWATLIATVLNLPVCRPKGAEFGAALGAARLGMCAATGALEEEVMTPPEYEDVIAPISDMQASFDAAYHAFRASYPAIRSVQ